MKHTGKSRTDRFSSLLSKALYSFIMVVGLAACGGGGSDDRPSLSINSPLVPEGNNGTTAELVFIITLSENAKETLTVDYVTADGTATAGSDYTTITGQLTIAKGSQTANVSVVVNGDDDFEQEETINLNISNPQGIQLAESSISGVAVIENDDDADPKGYFAGTATLNNTAYSDITALVYDKRILLFSPTANVLYDITMDPPTVNDYTGSVEVYVNGQIVQASSVTVTGRTNELQLGGTFGGGAGFGAGSFDVAFDIDNNEGATFGRIEGVGANQWQGNYYGIDIDTGIFSSSSSGGYGGLDNTTQRCGFIGQLDIPDPLESIYVLGHDIFDGGLSSCTYLSTGHSGFASVVDDTGTDDKMVFAFNNDSIALFGIMNR